MRRLLFLCFAASIVLPTMVTRADAQSVPDTENGRYTLSPVAGDFLRLDTRTGAVSTCSNKDGWVCRAVPDERSALDTEIGRLQSENKSLKEQLAQRDAAASGKADLTPKPDGKKSTDSLDSNFDRLRADNQKLLALIDKMWGRILEMANQVQKKLSEKI
ncbi:MAG: hypothetical protein HY242_15145 [Afipia sp.]|nr:hypothetical protein [Afipia sp.]